MLSTWLEDKINKILEIVEKGEGIIDKFLILKDKNTVDEILNHWGEILNKHPELSDYDIVTIENETTGLVKKEKTKFVLEKFESSKIKHVEQRIGVISMDAAESYGGFEKDPHIIKQKLVAVIAFLNKDFKALIAISSYLNYLYSQENPDDQEIQKIKAGVNTSFKNLGGVKFCDMYSKRYINGFLISEEKNLNKDNINTRLFEFIRTPVFFIHRWMKIEEVNDIIKNIQYELNKDSNYVAIHSLGRATELVRELITNITVKDEQGYKIVDIDEPEKETKRVELSKVWYHGEDGKRIYSYIT
jgi:hypothetical protein